MSGDEAGHSALALALTIGRRCSTDRVDDYIRSQLRRAGCRASALAVVKDGRIVKTAGYGVASLELDAPATERDGLQIGSISKQIAADAMLLLVEDGKIQLDDLVSKYLPAPRRRGRRLPFDTS